MGLTGQRSFAGFQQGLIGFDTFLYINIRLESFFNINLFQRTTSATQQIISQNLPQNVPKPPKGIEKNMFPILFEQARVRNDGFLRISRGPGEFRKPREACWNHFQLSWYLSDAVVTSYGQKPWGDVYFTVDGINQKTRNGTTNRKTISMGSNFLIF